MEAINSILDYLIKQSDAKGVLWEKVSDVGFYTILPSGKIEILDSYCKTTTKHYRLSIYDNSGQEVYVVDAFPWRNGCDLFELMKKTYVSAAKSSLRTNAVMRGLLEELQEKN